MALSANNKVVKLQPNGTSFRVDTLFGLNGYLGKADGTPGSGAGEFNSPFDVALSPDAQNLFVSDSNNHRIQEFDWTGKFKRSFGSFGTGLGQLNNPKGLTYGDSDVLHILDSGNNRLVLAEAGDVSEVIGGPGTLFGELQLAGNLTVGKRGIYIAEPGNNRVKKFDIGTGGYFDLNHFDPLWKASNEIGPSGLKSTKCNQCCRTSARRKAIHC